MEKCEFSIPNFISSVEETEKQKATKIKNIDGLFQKCVKDDISMSSGSERKCWKTGSGCSRIMTLVYISFAGFFCMICYDLPGSLETEIQNTFEVQPYQFEYLYSIYCIPNIFLSFCSGILIDRILGVKASALIVALFTLIGQIIFTIGGFVKMFWILLVARFTYGIGGDSMMVVLNYYAVLWFSGKGLNFVFGLGMSMSRLGTSFVFWISTYTNSWVKGVSRDPATRIGSSFIISIVSGLMILISILALGWESERNGKLKFVKTEKQENMRKKMEFNWRDIFVYPIKYWLLTVIFVVAQTAILVFVTCSQELLMAKYNVNASTANHLSSAFNLVLGIAAPTAGIIVDRIGWNMLIINLSLLVAALSQVIMAFANSSPYLPLILFGISCGILLSCVLPLTSKIVTASQLGAAFGMTIGLSDLSMALLNILVGYLLRQYGYETTCLFYASLFVVGLLSGLMLWYCDRKDGGTLSIIERFPA